MAGEEVSGKDILMYLHKFKEEMKIATETTNKKIEENSENLKKLDDKMENFKIDNDEKDKNTGDRFAKMEKRLAKIEEGARRMEYQRMKLNKLKQMDKEIVEDINFQLVRRDNSISIEKITPGDKSLYTTSTSYTSSWAQEVEAMNETEGGAGMDSGALSPNGMDKQKHKNKETNWQKNKTDENNTKDKENAASRRLEIAKETHKKEKIKKQGMRKLKRWFGDETEIDSSMATSDTDDDDDPSGWKKVQRKEKCKIRKKNQKTNKNIKVAQSAVKASHLLGVKPICKQAIDVHLQGNSYETAKILAVKEYLSHYLKFDEQEMDEMNIKETLVSAKGDDTIYIAFDDIAHIREIHIRMAECKNPVLSTRNFIPPGFYNRYMAANNKCSDVRQSDPEIKTQIRFSDRDIEILTKTRGTDEPYRPVNLNDFMGDTPLPLFDHSRKWNFRPDRPPRRKISYDNNTTDPLSVYKSTGKHAISRQNSQVENSKKKSKKSQEESSSSSSSSDDEMSGRQSSQQEL